MQLNRTAAVAYPALLLIIAVALSRLPFLDAGYGVHHDAWRVAGAARHIAETGTYEASRLPGYPVHEIICSLFYRGGAVALNGLSAAFSVAAALAVWFIARQLKCRDAMLLALAFAATPVVFVNSVSSKDYVWAIAFVLWALYAAMNRRAALSGLLVGLAIGCRITSGAMLLPLALILYGAEEHGRSRKALTIFGTAATITALTAFAPVWSRYGFNFFSFYHEHARPSLTAIATRGTTEAWGTLGVVGLLLAAGAAVLFARRTVPMSTAAPSNRFFIPAMGTCLVLYLVSFLALPDQAGYLIPLVAAVLFTAARFAPRLAFQACCICLLIAPWLDISGGKPVHGAVVSDHQERLSTLRDIRQFVAVTEQRLPTDTVIVVGAWAPIIAELFPSEQTHNRYVYLLSRAELEQAVASGAGIAYATEVIRGFNQRVHGIDLAAHGARNVRQMLVGRP